jgi:hypothetical protein
VQHSFGWPLDGRTGGGSFLYHLDANLRGDPWLDERGAETMRRLRGLDFLVPETLRVSPVRDSVDVELRTRDAWTTSLEFNVQSSNGVRYGTLAFSEHNLFGLGKGLSLSYGEEPAGITRNLEWNDPAVLGSRARFDALVSSGTAGSANQIDFGVPYYAPSIPHAYFADWRTAGYTQQLYADNTEAAELDVRREQTEVMWGSGAHVDATVTRWISSFYVLDRRLSPTRVVGPSPPEFAQPEDDIRLRRLALEYQWWRPRFIEREGVNRLSRVEDFDLGPQLKLKLGLAPRLLGSTASEGYLRAEVDAGLSARRTFGVLQSSIETRIRRTLRETIERVDARWYTPMSPRHVLVLATVGTAGQDVPSNFQLTAGGLSGLRAYPVHELSGHQLWRFNAEDRVLGGVLWDLINIGAAGFYDAARMTGPGVSGDPWRQNVGIGIRLAFAHSAISDVVRFDVAVPLHPRPGLPGGPVYSLGSNQAF